MLEVKIIIEATELANAINNLAAATGGGTKVMPVPKPTTNAPAVPIPVGSTSAVPTSTVSAPAVPTPTTNAPVNYPAPGVPLAQPPKYTVDQIMAAGATLMDAGKATELLNLLHSFGVRAVMDLKPEQLGAFATALRELGAKI